jgi:transcriptional regulator with XRE-family HTH domain
MSFGERLKALRQNAGLTQDQLAQQVGLYRESIARLENGTRDPGWNTVQAICRVLGVDCRIFMDAAPSDHASADRAEADKPPKKPARRTKK